MHITGREDFTESEQIEFQGQMETKSPVNAGSGKIVNIYVRPSLDSESAPRTSDDIARDSGVQGGNNGMAETFYYKRGDQ